MSRQKRVLIVEDDDALRAVMAMAFTEADWYAAVLDNGAGTVHSIKAQRPDVVLLDIVMEGVDGIQVLETLRQLAVAVPVVVVTGLPLLQSEIEGAVAVVPKPFSIDALIELAERVMAQAGEAPA